jgi:hypothetical protein
LGLPRSQERTPRKQLLAPGAQCPHRGRCYPACVAVSLLSVVSKSVSETVKQNPTVYVDMGPTLKAKGRCDGQVSL